MKKNESISFLKNIEKEYGNELFSQPRLISIDGVDGLGKSTFSKILVEILSKTFGAENVVLVDPTNLNSSPGQERLKSQLKSVSAKTYSVNPKIEDNFYLAGLNRAYQELVIPALKQGKLVILDRSEVDLVRFALEQQNELTFTSRLKALENGSATLKQWAGNRIFLSGDPEEVWQNLQGRINSKYDPQSLEEVIARTKFERKAEDLILCLPHKGDINVIRESVSRQSDPQAILDHLTVLAQTAIGKLKLS